MDSLVSNSLKLQAIIAGDFPPGKSNTTDNTGFDENCPWPRRLLHIQSLTSYEWRPGNRYGEHGEFHEPKYNAISYTWGRFTLGEGQDPTVEALPIKGVSWAKSLPRIRPDHFTTADMLRAISSVACPRPGYERVQFVWLDIACINQTPDSPEKASEIGRQIKIFQGAKDVFIWLPKHTTAGIVSWMEDMDRLEQAQSQTENRDAKITGLAEKDFVGWLQSASRALAPFKNDPWFTSLWTLQEAFLSPRAIFMWQDSILLLEAEDSMEAYSLKDWVADWAAVKARCDEDDLRSLEESKQLVREIDATGLFGGVRPEILTEDIDILIDLFKTLGSPFHLLSAASQRESKYDEDRVYGIMQIFDLRLGSSAPGETGKKFTTDQLEIQLASALLNKYPIFSQLVIHLMTPNPRPTWMITSAISFPEEAFTPWIHYSHGGEIINLASFSTITRANMTVAHFQGPLSPFSQFCQIVSSYRKQLSFISVKLDEPWNQQMGIGNEDISLFQDRSMEWIGTNFPTLQILLLGRLRPPPGATHDIDPIHIDKIGDITEASNTAIELDGDDFFVDWAVGLLMQERIHPAGRHEYHRIGFITWDLRLIHWLAKKENQPISSTHSEYLQGKGAGWTVTGGFHA